MKLYISLLSLCFLSFTISNSQIPVILGGYMDKTSYYPGDTAKIYFNADKDYANAKIFLYSINNVVVDSIESGLIHQTIGNSNPSTNGFGYKFPFNYKIPKLKSGYYYWSGNNIGFIVKNPSKNADVTIVFPTNTAAAYDSAGGKSLYNPLSTYKQKASIVSFLRPYCFNSFDSGFQSPLRYCKSFLQWIDKQNFNTQMVSDMDLDDLTEFNESKIIMIVGHNEYWTRSARLNLDEFTMSGKDAIILSGNSMWWQVRYNDDRTQMICYKDINSDPITNPLLKTTNWFVASLQYPILNTIGADFDHGAYGNKSFNHGWDGYKIFSPESPLLEGTKSKINDIISCPTLEYDGAPLSGITSSGDPILDTAALDFCTVELLAYDKGNWWRDNTVHTSYGTFIAYQKSISSGKVINTASTDWCSSNGIGGKDSSKIRTITLNMINKLLDKSEIFSVNAYRRCGNKPLGISMNISSEDIVIFPNPFSDKINISLPEKYFPIEFQIFDNMGRLRNSFKPQYSSSEYGINLSGLEAGVYNVHIHSNSGLLIKRIIKLNS